MSVNEDNIEKFYEAIRCADLTSIDQCIQEGLMIDKSYIIFSCMKYDYAYGRKRSLQSYITYFTPLICAVETQNIEVVQHLLKRGAAVLIKSEQGETPLSVAAKKGNLEMVKILVENGAKSSMQTALSVAIENKKLDIVQYLIEKGAYINWKYGNGNTPLSKSIKSKCDKITKFLIDTGANQIDKQFIQTAFLDAIEEKNLDVVQYMVERAGVTVNWKDGTGHTPLSKSITIGCGEISKFLVDNGANLEEIINGSTPLILSVENRMLDVVQYLVERGVSVNCKDKNGDTPLSKSITLRCEEMSKFLVDNGASLEELINDSTPLILSVEKQMLNILKYLIQKGANINQIDNKGRTALSVAASNRYLPFATYLIESGANIQLAQKEVDEYAKRDEEFLIFLKWFQMEQLKLKKSDEKEASTILLEKQSGSGQEEVSPPLSE